ncbi:MAG: tRNA pseudouridine(38-40) synthase TruA [Rikenellaceae bacterium]|nr:tRNA pseudouridine(38-40) synthase TruA [Rikenellaceae bacterium]
MRYFIELSYDGAAYCGWQRQPNDPSVQQTLEQALSTLLREKVEVVGAGRTDTGVNASYYVAHFDSVAGVKDCDRLVYKLNLILPQDVAVSRVREVRADAHARFDAVEREYTYYISQRKNPFRRHSAWQYYVPLDMERMNEAAQALTEYEDFTSFAKLNSNNKTNICRVTRAEWCRAEEDADMLVFRIRADRFLRNMIRAIVGTLVDVGRGRYTVEEFRDILHSRDLSRSSAGAPAVGLFLSDVRYDEGVYVVEPVEDKE